MGEVKSAAGAASSASGEWIGKWVIGTGAAAKLAHYVVDVLHFPEAPWIVAACRSGGSGDARNRVLASPRQLRCGACVRKIARSAGEAAGRAPTSSSPSPSDGER